jgi:hypothetical protein
VVIDLCAPEDLWIVSKPGLETHIHRLIDLDPDAKLAWEAGDIDLSGYLSLRFNPQRRHPAEEVRRVS